MDSSLTDAEKKAQKQGVVTEADKAKKAIDAAGSADAVDQAKDAGIKAIDAQHQSGQAVATRKDDAKKAIDDEAAKVTEAIDHDSSLTDAEKKAQKQGVVTEADKAKYRTISRNGTLSTAITICGEINQTRQLIRY
ncbi:DUF1542 domain-containing protein [Lacticaseibacillus rhamnosus]